MRKNLNIIAAYTIMMGLIILVGIFQSWNIALSIFNMCLISAVMTMGANVQWGYAGLINFGLMGYAALGGLAAVLISVDPVQEAWRAGGFDILMCLCLIIVMTLCIRFILKHFGKEKDKSSIIILNNKNLKKINISTKPYPGFPTDIQAQLMVLLTQAKGISKIKEDIFENRFMHVPELNRMGAKIETNNKIAIIDGPTRLTGAEVMATDLRASVSLVLAGLVAENRTIINRIYHLDRGYEFLEKKLKNCKAEIKRV